MRRVRAGTHGSAVEARQGAPRASGHARGRFRGAPECTECERARTKRYFVYFECAGTSCFYDETLFPRPSIPQHTPQTLIRAIPPPSRLRWGEDE
eukprot:8452897-Pyramimonas_sp.AAC.1